MSYDKIVDILDDVKNAKSIISNANFDKLFEILPAVDDGNCLFSSVEQLTVEFNLHELRQMVCDYYKTFDKYAEYPDNSIKSKLQIQMMSDNEPEEEGDTQLHEEVICTNFEWAGVMDVIALADILNINIILLIMGKTGYTFQPFLNKKKYNTICIKFNGRDHFEPLLPKFELGSPKSSSSKSKSKSKTKSKSKFKSASSKSKSPKSISSETKKLISQLENSQKDHLAAAKDISSETRKLISQIENSPKNALDTAKDISSETRRLISKMEENGFNDSKKKSISTKKNSPPKRATRSTTRRKRS